MYRKVTPGGQVVTREVMRNAHGLVHFCEVRVGDNRCVQRFASVPERTAWRLWVAGAVPVGGGA